MVFIGNCSFRIWFSLHFFLAESICAQEYGDLATCQVYLLDLESNYHPADWGEWCDSVLPSWTLQNRACLSTLSLKVKAATSRMGAWSFALEGRSSLI